MTKATPRSDSSSGPAVKSPLPPRPKRERLPDFIGLEILPQRAVKLSDEQQNIYKELWNKVAWAMGSSFNCPYRGSTQIRSLARRLVLIIIANVDQLDIGTVDSSPKE